MNTKPLRILALAAVAWQGALAALAQQVPLPPAGARQATPGIEHFQMGGAGVMPVAYHGQRQDGMVYGQPQYAQPQYGQHYTQPVSGPVVHEGDGYAGAQPLQPYWHQTPPHSFVNQVNDGMYYDPYQPDENGIASGAPFEGAVFDPIYPHGCCYVYTRAEVQVLTRDLRDDQAFTSLRVAGPIVLSLNDIEFEYEAGIRGAVGVPVSDCAIIEASYFGLNEWTETAAATDPAGNLFSVYSNFGTGQDFIFNGQSVFNFVDGSNIQSITYDSELHNAELNLLYRVPVHSCKQEAWLIAGARYVKLDETLQYYTEAQTNDPVLRIRSSFSQVQTFNDMVGGQLGGLLHHHITCKLRGSLDAKAAMMVNYHRQESGVATNLFVLGTDQDRDDALAFVTDAGASLAFDVNCWLSLTAGYRFMYMESVALAGRNFNPVLPGSGVRTTFLDNDGSVILHGAHFGGELRW